MARKQGVKDGRNGDVERCAECGAVDLPWLTTAQVADALQVSPRHVRNLVDAGDLAAFKDRGTIRVKHKSLHRYIWAREAL